MGRIAAAMDGVFVPGVPMVREAEQSISVNRPMLGWGADVGLRLLVEICAIETVIVHLVKFVREQKAVNGVNSKTPEEAGEPVGIITLDFAAGR
jgi:hypothetical protein